jgi:hypothetical protein
MIPAEGRTHQRNPVGGQRAAAKFRSCGAMVSPPATSRLFLKNGSITIVALLRDYPNHLL